MREVACTAGDIYVTVPDPITWLLPTQRDSLALCIYRFATHVFPCLPAKRLREPCTKHGARLVPPGGVRPGLVGPQVGGEHEVCRGGTRVVLQVQRPIAQLAERRLPCEGGHSGAVELGQCERGPGEQKCGVGRAVEQHLHLSQAISKVPVKTIQQMPTLAEPKQRWRLATHGVRGGPRAPVGLGRRAQAKEPLQFVLEATPRVLHVVVMSRDLRWGSGHMYCLSPGRPYDCQTALVKATLPPGSSTHYPITPLSRALHHGASNAALRASPPTPAPHLLAEVRGDDGSQQATEGLVDPLTLRFAERGCPGRRGGGAGVGVLRRAAARGGAPRRCVVGDRDEVCDDGDGAARAQGPLQQRRGDPAQIRVRADHERHAGDVRALQPVRQGLREGSQGPPLALPDRLPRVLRRAGGSK